MPTVRIAVASTPLTATLAEAVPAAVAAVEEAGRLGARVLCLPETAVPGHRNQQRDVPDVAQDELDRALDEIAVAVRRRAASSRSSAPSGPPRPGARSSASCSTPTAAGSATRPRRRSTRREEAPYVAGSGRRTFTAGRPDVRHRDLPRGVPLPGDQPRADARRRAGDLRAALGHHRGRPAADALDRRVEPVQREGADVPRAREHRLRRAVQQRRSRPGLGHRASSRPTARSSPSCRTARSAWRRPTSTCRSPTGAWPGAGRRSATARPSGSRR